MANNKDETNLEDTLFSSDIEAWIHGPVCPALYQAYKRNKIISHRTKNIDDKTKDILDFVIRYYGRYTGNMLEQMTHIEDPWKNARKGYPPKAVEAGKIEDKDIYSFYASKIR